MPCLARLASISARASLLLALAAASAVHANPAFDAWADRFSADWVRASPERATFTQYFSGAEHVLDATPPFWAWIAVEAEPPHGVACYVAQPNAVLAGARLIDSALATYRDCLESGRWPAYPETIEPLTFPRFALTFNE